MTLTKTQHLKPSTTTWIARLPAIVAGIVLVVVLATTLLGWPARPNAPNEETTTGIVVAVRPAEATGDADIVIYGYRLPDNTQVFGRVPIEPQSAHPSP